MQSAFQEGEHEHALFDVPSENVGASLAPVEVAAPSVHNGVLGDDRKTAEGTMRVLAATALLGMALVMGAGGPVVAAELEGIKFPDTATVDGTTVQLNGVGVRKAYVFVKVYVGALYLQTKTHDAKAAIETDEAKRIVLHMVRDVTHDEMKGAMQDGFTNTGTAGTPGAQQFTGYFTEPITTGQECEFDYAPGKGTT